MRAPQLLGVVRVLPCARARVALKEGEGKRKYIVINVFELF